MGSALSTRALLLAYEGFDYPEGETFIGKAGGYGFASEWRGTDAMKPNSVVLPGSFTYTDSFGNSIPTTGNRARVTGNGTVSGDDLPGGTTSTSNPWRKLDFQRGFDATPTTTWASVIAHRTGLPYAYTNSAGNVAYYGRAASPLQFFWNSNPTSTTAGNEMVGLGRASENTTGIDLYHTMDSWAIVNRGTAVQEVTSDVGFATLPADFLLVRIDHAPGVGPHTNAVEADTIYLWINPPNLAKEPSLAKADLTLTPVALSATNDRDYIFNVIRLFGGNFNTTVGYGSIEADELRIGTEFLDVTLRPVPEPSVLALGILGGFALLALRQRNR